MADPYATEEQLAEWLLGGAYEDETPTGEAAERVLARASELIGACSFGMYEIDSVTGLPVVASVISSLRDATCAQVEQWLEVGEENDIAGWNRRKSMSFGSVSVQELPAVLAPRAARILASEGILNDLGRELADDTTGEQPIGVDIV